MLASLRRRRRTVGLLCLALVASNAACHSLEGVALPEVVDGEQVIVRSAAGVNLVGRTRGESERDVRCRVLHLTGRIGAVRGDTLSLTGIQRAAFVGEVSAACRSVVQGTLVLRAEDRVVLAAMRPDSAKTLLAVLLVALAATLVLAYAAFSNAPLRFEPSQGAP